MTEASSMSHAELLQLHSKGKKFHRRTRSTFPAEILNLNTPETNSKEFAQDMAESHNLLSAEITQRVLDVPLNFENDREVIVDDIDDIPKTSAIVPKLSLGNNPMNFIKRRNLSAFTSAANNKCPVKKVNLFIDLQNINDLTGLDTIYERRNSIESADLEALDHSLGVATEPSTEKYILDLLSENRKTHSKHPSTESNKNLGNGSSATLSKKSTHSRQSSADMAYKGSKRESIDLRPAKDEEHVAKYSKPTHSKHSSIDFSNKENVNQRDGDSKQLLAFNSCASKAGHVKQSSLNLNFGTLRPANINSQPSRFKAQGQVSKTQQNSSQISLSTKNIENRNHEKVPARKPKKSLERQKNFYTLPAKDTDLYSQLDTGSKVIRKEPRRPKELTFSNISNINHLRNLSLYSAVNLVPSSKSSDRQQLSQTPHSQPRRVQADSMWRVPSNSTSPIRRINTTNITPNSREPVKIGFKTVDKRDFRVESDYQLTSPSNQVRTEVHEYESKEAKEVPDSKTEVLESTIKGLVEKTNTLEGQLSKIMQYVSTFKSDEANLKERVKTQEDQIQCLHDILMRYEDEMSNLRTAAEYTKTMPNMDRGNLLRRDALDTRLMTTDNSVSDSPFTENSGYLTCKESRRKGKISPFSAGFSGYSIQSTKNESRKAADELLSDYNTSRRGNGSYQKNRYRW